MLTPRPTIRAVAARIYNKGDRERQGAAVVGPAPTALVHTINDEENQHAFATSGDDRGGFRAPELPQVGPSAGDTQPPGSAVDAVNEKQISIFTFMKIVSAKITAVVARFYSIRLFLVPVHSGPKQYVRDTPILILARG